MASSSIKSYWLAALLFAGLFAGLLLARAGFISGWLEADEPEFHVPPAGDGEHYRETWMSILQNGEKIGYSNSVFAETGDGYRLREMIYLQVTTMGMSHQVHLDLTGRLNRDLSLASFESRLDSGRFAFAASGVVKKNEVVLTTTTAGRSDTTSVPVKTPIYLSAGMLQAIGRAGLAPGDKMTVPLFDPLSLTTLPVQVTAVSRENMAVMGETRPALRIRFDVKGMTQEAWIDETGEVLKETGMMGMSMIKTDKQQALTGLAPDGGDVTEMVSLAAGVTFDDPTELTMLTVALAGIDLDRLNLSGGRQNVTGNRVTITRESPDEIRPPEAIDEKYRPYLLPDMFIQSTDPAIKQLASEITSGADSLLTRAGQLVWWVHRNIEKRPVVSLPNALDTLTNREGDCNEHAVLLAALARATGIPARVETGLVYLNGRFYYHAWNALFVGDWVTADATLGQFPADVTHIRFTAGSLESTFDLLPVIGRLQLNVLDFSSGKETL